MAPRTGELWLTPRMLAANGGHKADHRPQDAALPRTARPVKWRALLRNPLFRWTAASIAVAVLLTLAWTETPLRDVITLERSVAWVHSVASRWWTPWALMLLYIPAGIIMFPRQLIAIAAVVAFGPWKGFAIAMAGVHLSSYAGYGLGRLMKRATVQRIAGPMLTRLAPLLRARGLMAVAMLRLLPIGPFFLGSIAAGAVRISLVDLTLGTFIGMTPGMVGTTLIGDQVAAGISADRHLNKWIIVASVALLVALATASHLWYRRISAAGEAAAR